MAPVTRKKVSNKPAKDETETQGSKPSKVSKKSRSIPSRSENKGPKSSHSRKKSTSSSKEPQMIDSQTQKSRGDKISYWLMKAEPESRYENGVDVKFSIDDLAAAKVPEAWDGVRNYVARNNMRAMSKGDQAFFYHSNCKTPGIVGIMEIVKEHTVDTSAQDPKHPYFDPKEDPKNPKWSIVHVEFRRKFSQLISLKNLQTFKGPGQKLENMQVLRQSRLSVSKVSSKEWDFILELEESQDIS